MLANELRQQEKETGWFKESNMSGMNHSCKSSLTMEDTHHRDPLDCNNTLFFEGVMRKCACTFTYTHCFCIMPVTWQEPKILE